VARGAFRQDLFYRLCGVTLVVPPLRERVSEIAGLVQSFIAEACRQAHRANPPSISPEALWLLQHYPWPGNIRELRNMMGRATLLCSDGPILPEHLPLERIRAAIAQSSRPSPAPAPNGDNGFHGQLEPSKQLSPPSEIEPAPRRKADAPRIMEALRRCGGNQTKAAKLLGVSRRYLIDRLDDYGLPRPRKLLGGRD